MECKTQTPTRLFAYIARFHQPTNVWTLKLPLLFPLQKTCLITYPHCLVSYLFSQSDNVQKKLSIFVSVLDEVKHIRMDGIIVKSSIFISRSCILPNKDRASSSKKPHHQLPYNKALCVSLLPTACFTQKSHTVIHDCERKDVSGLL